MQTSAELAELIASTIEREVRHLSGVPDGPGTAAPNRPGGTGWSQREELGHLIDSAVNNHVRFVRGALEAAPVGRTYDQTGWVEAHRYAAIPWSELIDLWHAHNRILVPLVAAVPDAKLATPFRIDVGDAGGGAPVALGWLIEDYVVHMRHHIDQILRRRDVTRYPRN